MAISMKDLAAMLGPGAKATKVDFPSDPSAPGPNSGPNRGRGNNRKSNREKTQQQAHQAQQVHQPPHHQHQPPHPQPEAGEQAPPASGDQLEQLGLLLMNNGLNINGLNKGEIKAQPHLAYMNLNPNRQGYPDQPPPGPPLAATTVAANHQNNMRGNPPRSAHQAASQHQQQQQEYQQQQQQQLQQQHASSRDQRHAPQLGTPNPNSYGGHPTNPMGSHTGHQAQASSLPGRAPQTHQNPMAMPHQHPNPNPTPMHNGQERNLSIDPNAPVRMYGSGGYPSSAPAPAGVRTPDNGPPSAGAGRGRAAGKKFTGREGQGTGGLGQRSNSDIVTAAYLSSDPPPPPSPATEAISPATSSGGTSTPSATPTASGQLHSFIAGLNGISGDFKMGQGVDIVGTGSGGGEDFRNKSVTPPPPAQVEKKAQEPKKVISFRGFEDLEEQGLRDMIKELTPEGSVDWVTYAFKNDASWFAFFGSEERATIVHQNFKSKEFPQSEGSYRPSAKAMSEKQLPKAVSRAWAKKNEPPPPVDCGIWDRGGNGGRAMPKVSAVAANHSEVVESRAKMFEWKPVEDGKFKGAQCASNMLPVVQVPGPAADGYPAWGAGRGKPVKSGPLDVANPGNLFADLLLPVANAPPVNLVNPGAVPITMG